MQLFKAYEGGEDTFFPPKDLEAQLPPPPVRPEVPLPEGMTVTDVDIKDVVPNGVRSESLRPAKGARPPRTKPANKGSPSRVSNYESCHHA